MFSKQIKLLKAILNNLEHLQKDEIVYINDDLTPCPFSLYPAAGLCNNAFLKELPKDILISIIKSWEFFDSDLGYNYFIGGIEEFCNANLYHNPKRIHFAKHALQYLKKLQGEVT